MFTQMLRFAVSCFNFTCGIFGEIILIKNEDPLLVKLPLGLTSTGEVGNTARESGFELRT